MEALRTKHPMLEGNDPKGTPYAGIQSRFHAAKQTLLKMQTLKEVQQQIKELKTAQGEQNETTGSKDSGQFKCPSKKAAFATLTTRLFWMQPRPR